MLKDWCQAQYSGILFHKYPNTKPDTNHIGITLRRQHPNSTLVIFADNDNHLALRGAENQGRYKAEKAIRALSGNAVIVEPDFGNLNASKEYSDWNDLIRLKGFDNAKMQIQAMLKQQFAQCEMTAVPNNQREAGKKSRCAPCTATS